MLCAGFSTSAARIDCGHLIGLAKKYWEEGIADSQYKLNRIIWREQSMGRLIKCF